MSSDAPLGEPLRDALDHIMRVARQGISPTKRLDWIEIRARYALEGKPWSGDIRETPRDSVKKMERDFAACRSELAALKAATPKTANEVESADARRFAVWYSNRNCLRENGIESTGHYTLDEWRERIDVLLERQLQR